jgi:hypothetical protein
MWHMPDEPGNEHGEALKSESKHSVYLEIHVSDDLGNWIAKAIVIKNTTDEPEDRTEAQQRILKDFRERSEGQTIKRAALYRKQGERLLGAPELPLRWVKGARTTWPSGEGGELLCDLPIANYLISECFSRRLRLLSGHQEGFRG